MAEGVKNKPLNMAENWTTIEEFSNFCNKEKERRLNSDNDFDEKAFEKAKNLALDQLKILKQDGWV